MSENDFKRGDLPGTSAPRASTSAHEPTDPKKVQTEDGSGAAGREQPITDSLDADEALGNRSGGYGGNPADVRAQTSDDRDSE